MKIIASHIHYIFIQTVVTGMFELHKSSRSILRSGIVHNHQFSYITSNSFLTYLSYTHMYYNRSVVKI